MRGYQPLESHRLCAVALASGVAALAATFTTVLNRGDHAIFSDTTYIAAYRLLNQILPEKYGVETPANPTLKVSDIATIAGIAHTAGALLSVTIRSIRRSTHGSSTAARSRCRCA